MKRIFCVVFVLMFFAAGSVFAQTPQELRIGSFLSGNLSEGGEVWYSVRTTQAGVLTVETDSSLDTYLEAYDAQRNLIAENDDGAGYPNARIELISQANTTYLFKVRAFSSGNGPFRIFAATKPVTVLRSGSAVSGNIAAGESIWYSVQTTQRGYLTVETSGSTDTILEAYDDAINYLAYDDDGAGYPNARIRIHVSPNKLYYFVLKSNNSGGFRITADNQAYPAATALAIGSFVNGQMIYGNEFWYSVSAAQTGYLIVETTGNVDTYIEAFDANYNYLAYSDGGGTGINAKLRLSVVAGNVYYFLVKSREVTEMYNDYQGYYSGYYGNGPFRIMASDQAYPTPTPVTVGSFININIEAGREYWYILRTTSRGRYIIETSGNTDTVLEAFNSTYESLQRVDDYMDINARIALDVAANQTYIFKLTGYGDYTQGPTRLFISLEN